MPKKLYMVIVNYNFDDFVGTWKPYLSEEDAIKEMNRVIDDEIKEIEANFGYTPELLTTSETDKTIIYSFDDGDEPGVSNYHVIEIDCTELDKEENE